MDDDTGRARRPEREGPYRGRGPGGWRRPDARIREDICERLADSPWIDATDVAVEVHDGEVTLDGTVEGRDAKRRADAIAARVSGVGRIRNNLRTREQAARAAGRIYGGTTRDVDEAAGAPGGRP